MPFKNETPQRRLIDIRHNIHLAQRFVESLSYEAFRDNDLVFYAVTRALHRSPQESPRFRSARRRFK